MVPLRGDSQSSYRQGPTYIQGKLKHVWVVWFCEKSKIRYGRHITYNTIYNTTNTELSSKEKLIYDKEI